MDIGNTSGSSSSTIIVPEKFGDESGLLLVTEKDKDKGLNRFTLDNKQDPCTSQVSPSM